MFDGQVGDAAPGVHLPGRDDGVGGAVVEAGAAIAAMIAHRRVHRQRQISEDFAQKEPRAGLAGENVGMLAHPAESRAAGDGLLQNRRAVHEHPVAEGADRLRDALGQPLQPLAHQFVIVPAQRITRYVTAARIPQYRPGVGGVGRQVVHAHADDATGAGHQFRRSAAQGAVALHPRHLACHARLEPGQQARLVLGEIRIANAHGRKSQFGCPAADPHDDVLRCGSVDGYGLLVLPGLHKVYDSRMSTLPVNLYRAAQCRELDRLAIETHGISGNILMERAGGAAFHVLREAWPQARRIVVLCGVGNNGGDGYVLARLAHEQGLEADVYQIGDADRIRGDALSARQRLMGVDVIPREWRGQPLDCRRAGGRPARHRPRR